MTTLMIKTDRRILGENENNKVAPALQQSLTTLIDLALQLKQAHWNVVGKRFLSFHKQLDEIVETVRHRSDEIAERIATLSLPADGRSLTVAQDSKLEMFPMGRHLVKDTVTLIADRLKDSVTCLRESISEVGKIDPITEDLLIQACGELEKHLWMVQSQELEFSGEPTN